ncbi:hypothetical protein BDW69DRAFT_173322 [Aspergillus filifer]
MPYLSAVLNSVGKIAECQIPSQLNGSRFGETPKYLYRHTGRPACARAVVALAAGQLKTPLVIASIACSVGLFVSLTAGPSSLAASEAPSRSELPMSTGCEILSNCYNSSREWNIERMILATRPAVRRATLSEKTFWPSAVGANVRDLPSFCVSLYWLRYP